MAPSSLGRRQTAWSCCALLLLSSLVLAQTPATDVGRREVRANSTSGSTQGSVALAVSDDGAAAVAWVSRRQQAGYDAVCLQRYDSEGRRDGGETMVWAAPGSQQRGPSVALVDDALWVAWASFDRAEGARAYLRKIEVGSEPVALGGRDAHSATLAELGRELLAVWIERGSDGERVWCRRFDRDGQPTGEAVPLSAAGEGAALPSAAALIEGGAVVVWMAPGRGLRARRLGAEGEPDGDEFALADAGGAGDIEPSVAGLPGGGFAVAWMRAGDGDRYAVVAAAYARTGEPRFEPVQVDVDGDELSGAAVAVTPDGARLCVGWNAVRYDGEDRDVDVRARWLKASGEAQSEPFAVTQHTAGDQTLLPASNRRALACGPDGELLVAWEGDGGLGDPKAAHLTWIVPGAAAGRLADAGPATPPAPAAEAEELKPLPTGVVQDSTRELGDEPIFTGAVAQTRGEANPLDGSGFEAITNTGWLPPDPHMAVGPDHVVTMVNGGIAFFKKDGTRTFFQDINGSGGFWGSLGAGGFVFDPRVLFDMHSGRWLVMAAEHQGVQRGYFDLAVSDDDDPNGTWFKYRFDLTSQIGTYLIDFPHLGVDERAVYISGTVFYSGTNHIIYVIDKQPLLTGQPVTPKVIIDNSLNTPGMGAQIGSSAAGYLVQAEGSTSFRILAITNSSTTPQLVEASVTVPSNSNPARIPQRGSSIRFSAVDRRVSTIQYVNGRLYAVHNTDSPARARWYEFHVGDWPNSGPAPTLVQSGALVTEGASTFLPSISADIYGNVLVCCAKSSPNEYVSVSYFYHLNNDPSGTMRGPFVAKASNNPYTANSRWGDYSAAALDPRDRATFWFNHEWAASSSSWSTWVEAQRLQGPTLTASVPTISAATGGSVTLDLDNAPYGGRAYIMLGGASGTSPGFRLPDPPAIVNMDLNIDGFTVGLLSSINSPTFDGFLGTLDASGKATATFRLPPLPVLAGINLWFAYAQDGSPSWDFASETVQIGIVP